MAYKEGGEEMTQQKENEALMEALEPTWANRELANVIRNLMHQGGWGLDADAHDWRSDHPLLQAIATLSRLAPLPAEREADGEAVGAKPWYETDAHRDLSRIIPDMEGKIADAEKRFAHCLPDHLFAPLKASITELRVLRHELSALSAQPVSEQGEVYRHLGEPLRRALMAADNLLAQIDAADMDADLDPEDLAVIHGAKEDIAYARTALNRDAALSELAAIDGEYLDEPGAPQTDGGKA